LLEIGNDVIIESEVIARRIATEFCEGDEATGSILVPPGQQPVIDRFIHLWTHMVEKRYYDVLTAPTEDAAKYLTYLLLEALIEVENLLWEPRVLSS